MTTEMDALPESVRNAVSAIDSGNGVFVDSDDGIGGAKWRIVRAALLRYREMVSDRSREMLRLVSESGELKTRAEKAEARVQELERENGWWGKNRDRWEKAEAENARLNVLLDLYDDQAGKFVERAERAESELAAIKKRIAEAETFVVHRHPAGAVMATYMCNSKLDGKRVALLPLDDEEPKQ